MLRQYWDQLNPKQQRMSVAAVVSVSVLGAIATFAGEEQNTERNRRKEQIVHVLTDSSTRDVGIDSLSADIKILEKKNADLLKELTTVKGDLEATKAGDQTTEIKKQLQELQKEMSAIQIENGRLEGRIKDGFNKSDFVQTEQNDKDKEGSGASTSQHIDVTNPNKYFQEAELPVINVPVDVTGKPADPSKQLPTVAIQTHSGQEETEVMTTEQEDTLFLPSGSIMTGVIVNGLDAPTSQSARKDPFPLLIRLQKEALLPNRYRADIRECFLLASGYGDLSSERAYLRGENLSCVRTDGEIIETKLNSYVVGEDGKAGVRGRLVSKNGQLIAKSLMAGFLSGASEAFDVNVIPMINTTGNTEYQTNDMSEMLKGAGAKGTSTSLEMIAEYYLDMAESIFPVIEIDAGRVIDVIVTKGTNLTVRTNTGPNNGSAADSKIPTSTDMSQNYRR